MPSHIFGAKYADALTIVFVFLSIAFFDIIHVTISLERVRLAGVISAIVAIILLLGCFSLVVASHTRETSQKVEVEKVSVVQTPRGGVRPNSAPQLVAPEGVSDPWWDTTTIGGGQSSRFTQNDRAVG